jgi:hypothetical protein
MKGCALLLLGLLLPVSGAVAAPKPGQNVWYKHRLPGGGESGDWLCVHQQGKAVKGFWCRRIGDSGEVFLVQADQVGNRWEGAMWQAQGGDGRRVRFMAVTPGPKGTAPKVGDAALLLGEKQVRFVRSTVPRFYQQAQQ